MKYQNTDGAGGHLPNKSYFTNVTFTWDDAFLADYPLGHVTLYKVDGIKFRGCTFNDRRTAPNSRYYLDYAKTNSGIYSIDAQYFVMPQCTDYIGGCSGSLEDDPDWNPTTFENLDFGVYASNISSEQNITVDRSIFENNLYGLQTVNVNDPIITRNEFEVNGDTTNNFTSYTQRGIHLVRSKGLTVQENHFENSGSPGAIHGIICSDLGESEEDIYLNTFDDLKYGVIAQGKNRGEFGLEGLEFICDTNNGNFKDHLVLGSLWGADTSDEFGVKAFNGNIDEPSGTVFSLDDPFPTGIHYTNESENELRYYYFSLGVNKEPEDVIGDVYPEGLDIENTCPSKLSDDSFQGHSSGFLSTTLSNFNTYSADLDTALNEYQGLVNGGNTDSLLTVIAGLTRNNRDTVHALLMSYSPYLTAEVVKATLDHPVIKYPHAWGYELVESNIEVAYTPGFFTFLENKLNPFSATMIADVQALVDSSAYTDMLTKQLKIAKLQSQKANAANVLLQSVKNDTNSVDVDSVRYWITQKGDVLAKTREIDAYLQAGEITAAETALSSLNANLQNYPAHLQDELTDYISFKEKLIDLHQAGSSLDSLSETDHNFMTDLAENGVGLARYQAQELLCFFYDECAEYPVNPDGQQSMAPMFTDTEALKVTVERSFKIYPNPANTWIAIELPTVDEPLNITVVDLTGRVVYQKQLGGINNTDRLSAVEIWDTQLIGDGVYLITITNQNNTESFGTQRVVIQH